MPRVTGAAAAASRARSAPSQPSPASPSASARVSLASPRPPHLPGAAGRQRQRQCQRGECGHPAAWAARAGGARRPRGWAASARGRRARLSSPGGARGLREWGGVPAPPTLPQPPPSPPQTKRRRWEAPRAVSPPPRLPGAAAARTAGAARVFASECPSSFLGERVLNCATGLGINPYFPADLALPRRAGTRCGSRLPGECPRPAPAAGSFVCGQ